MAEISEMLPGYNCGECGHRQCKDYAKEVSIKGDFNKCPHLELDRFIDTKAEIQQFLSTHIFVEDKIEVFRSQCRGCGEGISGPGYGEGINTKSFDVHWYLAHGLSSNLNGNRIFSLAIFPISLSG